MATNSEMISAKIRRVAAKSGMLPAAISDYVEKIGMQFELNDIGKVVHSTSGKSVKKTLKETLKARPEIFAADALVKTGEPFNAATASAKRSNNPWSLAPGVPENDAKRAAVISRMGTKFAGQLAAACNVDLAARPLRPR
jgi:hypothetical protein